MKRFRASGPIIVRQPELARSEMRGEAEFHFAHLSLYGFAEPARFGQAVCRAQYSRVTLWCHGNRG